MNAPEFAWLITEDHVDGIKAGMLHPASLAPEHSAALTTPSARLYPFDLEGPDGETLYRGLGYWPDPSNEGTEPGLLAPLSHSWAAPVERIVWADFPEDTDPVLFNLDAPNTRPLAPVPDRLAHIVGMIRDLSHIMPAGELRPRITNAPELSAAERTAALAELERVTNDDQEATRV